VNDTVLILGIDPGTTLGCAILDTDGNLVKLFSSKQFGISSLISVVADSGKPLIIASDKKRTPSLIKNISSAFGARIIAPPQDLTIKEKNSLTTGFNPKNDHERDALAAALFGYKKIRPLLKKITLFVKENKKEDIKDRLIEIVVKKQISIKKAAKLLEPSEKKIKIEKEIIQPKQRNPNLIYTRLRTALKDISLLRRYNQRLKNKIKKLKEKNKALLNKTRILVSDTKLTKMLEFKEKRILFLDQELKKKDREIKIKEEEIAKLNKFLSKLNENFVAKKLINLSWAEFKLKHNLLNIQESDILLVHDPNQYSNKVVEKLKDKIKFIIVNKDLNSKLSLPFVFIPAKNLRIEENKYFALVNKDDFNKEKGRINLLFEIIESYKKKRRS